MTREERICKYLSACPPAVSGQKGHTQTFSVACNLYNGFAMSQQELEHWLAQYNVRCQPPWNENELAHKVQQAMAAQHSRPRGCLIEGSNGFHADDYRQSSFAASVKKQDPKPKLDPVTAIEKRLDGFRCGEADLWEASPIRPADDFTTDGCALLSALYQPEDRINVVTEFKMSEMKDGKSKAVPMGYGITRTRNEWITEWAMNGPAGTDAGGWMRMNPTDGHGIGDKNISTFRFILLEFDSIPLELQISLIVKLPLPISAVLTSGGKSIHAWVKVDAMDLIDYRDTSVVLLKFLAPFGIDDKNKNPSRLSRLVGVTRKIDASRDGRQRLLYVNPKPTGNAICP